MVMGIAEEKAKLRKEMLGLRSKMAPEDVEASSLGAMRALAHDNVFLCAESIGFYSAFKNEIDLSLSAESAMRRGVQVCYPKMHSGGKIEFMAIHGFAELAESRNGMDEPVSGEAVVPDVLLVPGLAFDFKMNRLGFGKGCYDRYLAESECCAIGVCHPWQVLGSVPCEKHDRAMNKIVAGDFCIEG
jgi:5-formyltetrahydrofolate cyclo-ligase